MFTSVDDLMFIKDSNFRIVQANPAFIALYPPEQQGNIIGFTTFESYPEEQMRVFVQEDQRALDEGYSEVQETIDFPDGHTRTLLTRKIGFNDFSGERYVFGISRDITKIKNTEEALEAANLELEEFAYRVSHDLRSPLVSSIELLERASKAFENNSIEEAKKLVDISKQSLGALETLAKDILSLHQMRRAETKNEVIDFEKEVTEIWTRYHLGDDSLKLDQEYHYDTAPIADRYGVVQVLENLVSNAVKYRTNEIDISNVRVSVTSTSRTIMMSVEDNGIGIPDVHKDQMFGMFQRFNPRYATGSGLGLYMVSQWVARVGGKIKFEQLKPGTLFSVEIPQGKIH